MKWCCCSVAQMCPTLWNPMDCSTPGLPVPHHLPKFAPVHVHCIGDTIQPSHPLTPSSPSALNLSQHQGLFQWVSCSLSDDQNTGVSALASVLPMSIWDWFPSRLTGLILLSKGLSGVFSSTIVQRHQFFSTQLLYHPAITTMRDHREDHSLNYPLKHVTLGEHNPAPHSIPCFTALLRQLATQMSSVRTRRCVCTGVITSTRKDVSPAQQPTSVGFLHL